MTTSQLADRASRKSTSAARPSATARRAADGETPSTSPMSV
ncbi:hypothetical protein [Conexibacter sp. W3-3-2]|nr:hypothetical protein [Conexibacter sp. W3-3-2]